MTFELRIESLAFGGRAFGRHEGQAVFVPFGAPGDLLRCRVVQRHKRYLQAEIVEILEPSPERESPRCPLFGDCGGCQWQHLPYERQRVWKQRLHHEQLQRSAGISTDLVAATVAAEPQWNYRSRAQFKCFQSRQGFVLGFYRSGSHFVIDLEQCPICHPRINAILPALKTALAASVEPQRIPQVDVAVGDDERLRVVVHYIGRQRQQLTAELAEFADAHDCALLLQSGRKQTLTLISGEPQLEVEPQPGLPLAYDAGGFAQVHLEQNRRLVEMVRSAVGSKTGRVLDLFCGMGNFTLPLARQVGAIVGLENYPPSIAQAQANARRHAISNARFAVADCERGLETYWREGAFDLVVLDPPRSGAQAACKTLASLRPPRIVYVSCDSATLARDLKVLLGHGYRLEGSTPVDMFPQTAHIESVSLLALR